MNEALAPVAEFSNRSEAEVVRARLASAGIAASVHADDVGGLYPHLGQSGVRVMVRQDDLDEAHRVLAATPD